MYQNVSSNVRRGFNPQLLLILFQGHLKTLDNWADKLITSIIKNAEPCKEQQENLWRSLETKWMKISVDKFINSY